MLNFSRRRMETVGLPPGSLIHVGEKRIERTTISLVDYDEIHFETHEDIPVEETFVFRDRENTTWIHIQGIHDPSVVEKIGTHYHIHPLVLEDVLNTDQRPKIDRYEKCLYVVMKSIRSRHESTEEVASIIVEQVSIILGPNFVISFQESGAPIFEPVKKRILNRMGRIRKLGNDYLAYALMDTIVDDYFLVLDDLEDEIEKNEEDLILDRVRDNPYGLYQLKRQVLYVRKAIYPVRDLVLRFQKPDIALVSESTIVYVRDLYDHVIQLIDIVETFREMSTNLLGLYHTSISNRMNEVMKVLTIISTTFIPLSFITGLYGMNFRYMPELEWRWGYPMVWGIILAVALTLLVFFKRKKWL